MTEQERTSKTIQPRNNKLEGLENIIIPTGFILGIGGLITFISGAYADNIDLMDIGIYSVGMGAVPFLVGTAINIYKIKNLTNK